MKILVCFAFLFFVPEIILSQPQYRPLERNTLWINEFHYDNAGVDFGEFVEVAGLSGQDLSGVSIWLYSGTTGLTYASQNLIGVIPNEEAGRGTLSFNFQSIFNGTGGIALVHNGEVLEFISYEGQFVALDGPAVGHLSDPIPVEENSTVPIGFSLQLTDLGSLGVYRPGDVFFWTNPRNSSPGAKNQDQTFGESAFTPVDQVMINEVHYNNLGTDVGEFVELVYFDATPSNGLVQAFDILVEIFDEFGGVIDQITIPANDMDSFFVPGETWAVKSFPWAGLPDDRFAIAASLFPNGDFGCYDGAIDQVSFGIDMTPVVCEFEWTETIGAGVQEDESTPIGSSLQLARNVENCPPTQTCPDLAWYGPRPHTPNETNSGQQNPYLANDFQFKLNLEVFLSGAYNGEFELTQDLLDAGILADQAFKSPHADLDGCGYGATVNPSFFDTNNFIVDWVCIELRDRNNPERVIESKAAFVTNGGEIMDYHYPNSEPVFRSDLASFYIVVRHRNHLSVMSDLAIDANNGSGTYFFTTSQGFGIDAQRSYPSGTYGLWSGDGNADDAVTAFDFLNTWLPVNGTSDVYLGGDFNMDGQITAFDFLQNWLTSNGVSSQVPD